MWPLAFAFPLALLLSHTSASLITLVSSPSTEHYTIVQSVHPFNPFINEESSKFVGHSNNKVYLPNHEKIPGYVLGYFCGKSLKESPTYNQSDIFDAAKKACESLGDNRTDKEESPEWYTASNYKIEGPYIQWPLIRVTGSWGRARTKKNHRLIMTTNCDIVDVVIKAKDGKYIQCTKSWVLGH